MWRKPNVLAEGCDESTTLMTFHGLSCTVRDKPRSHYPQGKYVQCIYTRYQTYQRILLIMWAGPTESNVHFHGNRRYKHAKSLRHLPGWTMKITDQIQWQLQERVHVPWMRTGSSPLARAGLRSTYTGQQETAASLKWVCTTFLWLNCWHGWRRSTSPKGTWGE